MQLKQLSVFVENTTGRLNKLMRTLADNGIDLIAISISDTVDFGILRCIVNDPDKAEAVLKNAGFTASTTKVLAVELEDRPGGFADVLELLSKENIGVNYVYSFARAHADKALILFKVDDPKRATEVLSNGGVRVLGMSDMNDLY